MFTIIRFTARLNSKKKPTTTPASSKTRVLKSPGMLPPSRSQKYHVTLVKILHREKAYIPVSREQEYVVKATINKKRLKKEVITTSNKAKKKVAPASKTAPAASKNGAKKSGGKKK